jgi:hypothetical protein
MKLSASILCDVTDDDSQNENQCFFHYEELGIEYKKWGEMKMTSIWFSGWEWIYNKN